MDVRRAAHALLKRRGDDADFVAARYADAQLANGNQRGCSEWLRVKRAVETLRHKKLREGEAVN